MAGPRRALPRRFAGILITSAILACSVPVSAAEEPPESVMCPVTRGEPAKPSIYADYQGVRVYFCCTKCRARFERNPLAYTSFVPRLAGDPPGGPASGPGDQSVPAAQESAGWTNSRAVVLLGRLHPVVVHFPIALLLLAAASEGASMVVRGKQPSRTARLTLGLGALGALAAAAVGWLNAGVRAPLPDDGDVLALHRWLGVGLAGVTILAAGASLLALSRRAVLSLYRVLLFISALGVVVVGHLGGTLVYGPGYLTEPFLATAAPVAETTPVRAPALRDAARTPATPAPALAALFAASPDELMVKRREFRVSMLPPPPDPPITDLPAHNPIDRFIAAAWERAGLPEATRPPPVCDDETFLRRVYLDVIGVVPTLEERRRFLADARGDRRERLIDELLSRAQDYADHWTPFWEDALGSTNVNNQGGIPGRGNYREWINASFRDNKPYDLFAAELIDPGMPGRKPTEYASANGRVTRTQYVMNESHTATLQTAAAVGQVFLGSAMKCASCHSHFENDEWPQRRFLAYAGLFADHDLELVRCESPTGETVPAAFPFDIEGVPTDAPRGEEARLRRLAQLLTDPANPRFAAAIVNRLWKRYFGLGLFEPADDFRLDRPPSHPELLQWLAHDFMIHGYDLKHTIRLILTSRTYQLAYAPALEDAFDAASPEQPRYFRSPRLRRLTAEQIIDSVRRVTQQDVPTEARSYRDTASTALSRALARPASRNEISTSRSEETAVVQGLELLNGAEWSGLIGSGRLVFDVLSLDSPGAAAQMLYRAAQSREPTTEEASLVESYLSAVWDTRAAAAATERLWLSGELPPGASTSGDWTWVEAADGPWGGGRVHSQSAAAGTPVQHYLLGLYPGWSVGPSDTLIAHVYLDPADPPSEILVQWNDGSDIDGGWAHRAYWGADQIPFGIDRTSSRRPMGPLPEAGVWIRLEVAALEVGLGAAARTVVGLSFDQVGGTVRWGPVGIVERGTPPAAEAVADVLWALFTSPEFQYVK